MNNAAPAASVIDNLPTFGQWVQNNLPLLLVLAGGVLVGLGFLAWYFFQRRKTKQKRKRSDQRRKLNPTLAQTGGLPPARDPNRPPQPPNL